MKMRTTKQLIVTAIITLCISFKADAAKIKTDFHKNNFLNRSFFISMPSDDPNLQLTLVKNDWDINLHISFNGNEGTNGTIKVYNSSNQFVNQFNISLVNSPAFSSINLGEWSSGTYLVELTTASGVHTSHFTI